MDKKDIVHHALRSNMFSAFMVMDVCTEKDTLNCTFN